MTLELNGKYDLPQGELWENYSTGRKQEVQRPGRGRQRGLSAAGHLEEGGREAAEGVGRRSQTTHICRAANPFYTMSYIT